MKTYSKFIAKCLLLLSLSTVWAQATTIAYTTTQLSANRWRYDYTIHNDSLSAPLQEFTIYFKEGLFANLVDESAATGWDLLLVQPDLGIPAAGFLDGLALGSGIAADASLGGLSVSFDYFGAGIPGQQLFSVVDPATFVELDSGQTGTAAIPLPGTLGLAALGLVALAFQRRRHGGVR